MLGFQNKSCVPGQSVWWPNQDNQAVVSRINPVWPYDPLPWLSRAFSVIYYRLCDTVSHKYDKEECTVLVDKGLWHHLSKLCECYFDQSNSDTSRLQVAFRVEHLLLLLRRGCSTLPQGYRSSTKPATKGRGILFEYIFETATQFHEYGERSQKWLYTLF